MTPLQFWFFTGIISVLLTVLGLIFSKITDRLVTKLDALIEEVSNLAESTGIHKQELSQLNQTNRSQGKRLQQHDDRIRELEIQNAKNNKS